MILTSFEWHDKSLCCKKMRILCDVCESAAASFFCAADEAALCTSCDAQVHMCNKLASRHLRVRLADPSAVPQCDICENAPAFFYCEVDGSALCLQCDMGVHVGSKKTHGRYLMLRQKFEFPADKPGQFKGPSLTHTDVNENGDSQNLTSNSTGTKIQHNGIHHSTTVPVSGASSGGQKLMETKMFDLNMKPKPHQHGQGSSDER